MGADFDLGADPAVHDVQDLLELHPGTVAAPASWRATLAVSRFLLRLPPVVARTAHDAWR